MRVTEFVITEPETGEKFIKKRKEKPIHRYRKKYRLEHLWKNDGIQT